MHRFSRSPLKEYYFVYFFTHCALCLADPKENQQRTISAIYVRYFFQLVFSCLAACGWPHISVAGTTRTWLWRCTGTLSQTPACCPTWRDTACTRSHSQPSTPPHAELRTAPSVLPPIDAGANWTFEVVPPGDRVKQQLPRKAEFAVHLNIICEVIWLRSALHCLKWEVRHLLQLTLGSNARNCESIHKQEHKHITILIPSYAYDNLEFIQSGHSACLLFRYFVKIWFFLVQTSTLVTHYQ